MASWQYLLGITKPKSVKYFQKVAMKFKTKYLVEFSIA